MQEGQNFVIKVTYHMPDHVFQKLYQNAPILGTQHCPSRQVGNKQSLQNCLYICILSQVGRCEEFMGEGQI